MSPTCSGCGTFDEFGQAALVSSTSITATCDPPSTLRYFQWIMKPSEYKSYLPIRLEGGNFAEWKFELDRWVFSQPPICRHIALGLINWEGVDSSVQPYYANVDKKKFEQLSFKAEELMIDVALENMNPDKFKINDLRVMSFGSLLAALSQECKKRIGSMYLTELKSRVTSKVSPKKGARHRRIYGPTDWKIEYLDILIDPFKVSEKKFIKFWNILAEKNLDEKLVPTAFEKSQCEFSRTNCLYRILQPC
ncbi:hypothetical protein ACI3LY_003919 [Candidozyma auris]|uniref:Uncharacterized protein n=2 Tax=Candidozyma auris TaxID=498019 RepID=A0A8F2W298_CANAR|nr:hypothetical protein CA7LBN_002824 [[Candida] auris]